MSKLAAFGVAVVVYIATQAVVIAVFSILGLVAGAAVTFAAVIAVMVGVAAFLLAGGVIYLAAIAGGMAAVSAATR